ncbi:hypothetical protein CPB84DRAFT_1769794 [Gymnopilus junonius]|uniref:Uncharacterized protein n=1 Tax=Gymnopilus junonius TaxID=109634 RepID=A0A9P5NVL9_GYMJU|nr:hypothetical protein CPB84DRAFT_1769794 [Gymnopilus junonius]
MGFWDGTLTRFYPLLDTFSPERWQYICGTGAYHSQRAMSSYVQTNDFQIMCRSLNLPTHPLQAFTQTPRQRTQPSPSSTKIILYSVPAISLSRPFLSYPCTIMAKRTAAAAAQPQPQPRARSNASRNPWSKSIPPPTAPPPIPRIRRPRKIKLPQDIIYIIIDYLWDQPSALKSCSLSSRSFLFHTRRNLYIKDLVVIVQTPAAWVLPTLYQVTRLANDVSSASRRALSSILMADHVESCSLHDILNFDSLYLSRCLSLRHLELSGCSTLTPYHPPRYFSNPPPSLPSLTIGDHDDSLHSLLNCCVGHEPAFMLNSLQKLDVEEDVASRAFADLPFCFSRLPRLSFGYGNILVNDSLPTPEPIGLSQFQRLTSVELRSVHDQQGLIFALRSARIMESISHPSILQQAYWSCVDAALFYLPLPPLSSVQFRYGTSVLFSDSVKTFTKVRSLGVHVHLS